jgi:hypothetical protein
MLAAIRKLGVDAPVVHHSAALAAMGGQLHW